MKNHRIILIVFLIAVSALAGLLAQITSQLPDVETINSYQPHEATTIYADDGKIFATLHEEENRRVVPLSKISDNIVKAVIASEDSNFYKHHGIDAGGVLRAALRNLRAGSYSEGGSTITQQLARNLFLTKRKTLLRKFAEIILAIQIERRYSKEEILELYLNQIYFGHNSYGVESATNLYFGKSASEVSQAEAAMLAGVIEAPERLSPYKNFNAAKKRQKQVLLNMIRHSMLTIDDADRAYAEIITLHPERIKSRGKSAAYFISYVLDQLVEKYGSEAVNMGGLKVYTTVNARLQEHAEKVVAKYLTEEGKKYNFSQAALLSIDPKTGYIKALIGGADYKKSQFNRATQSKRPPGSSFKPFVYIAALEKGISPGHILADKPVTFQVFPNKWNPDGTWSPKNFDKKYSGNVTMRYALEHSLNIPAIKVLELAGVPQAIDTARRMGIKSPLENALSLTLGVYDVTMLEMTAAYSSIANHGIYSEPIAIKKVLSRENVILEDNQIEQSQAIEANIAAVIIDMMRGVLDHGTGFKGRLDRPAAAKTGTTEDFKDAWFIGFVPQLTTAVWVGNDDNRPMRGVAEVAVCPRMWRDYMQFALINDPVQYFPAPEGMAKISICKSSGLLPGRDCPQGSIISDIFFKSDLPGSVCNAHGQSENSEETSPNEDNPPEWLKNDSN